MISPIVLTPYPRGCPCPASIRHPGQTATPDPHRAVAVGQCVDSACQSAAPTRLSQPILVGDRAEDQPSFRTGRETHVLVRGGGLSAAPYDGTNCFVVSEDHRSPASRAGEESRQGSDQGLAMKWWSLSSDPWYWRQCADERSWSWLPESRQHDLGSMTRSPPSPASRSRGMEPTEIEKHDQVTAARLTGVLTKRVKESAFRISLDQAVADGRHGGGV